MGNDTIVDENADSGLDTLTKDLSDAVAQNSTATETAEAPQHAQMAEKPAWIEDKFWTGDVEESATKQHESLRNLQSAYGRMANDLGTQRKLTDQILNFKREDDLNRNTPERVQVEGADLLDRPNETLDAFIEPRLEESTREVNERLAAMETALAQQAFVAAHPDYNEIANDEGFQSWIQASPYRASMAQNAVNGNYNAAHELLTEWKLQRGQAPGSGNTEESAPAGDDIDGARKAGLESTASGQSTNSGKVYRRSDLIRLKLERPDVYEAPDFQQEILQAYAEGRVK